MRRPNRGLPFQALALTELATEAAGTVQREDTGHDSGRGFGNEFSRHLNVVYRPPPIITGIHHAPPQHHVAATRIGQIKAETLIDEDRFRREYGVGRIIGQQRLTRSTPMQQEASIYAAQRWRRTTNCIQAITASCHSNFPTSPHPWHNTEVGAADASRRLCTSILSGLATPSRFSTIHRTLTGDTSHVQIVERARCGAAAGQDASRVG